MIYWCFLFERYTLTDFVVLELFHFHERYDEI